MINKAPRDEILETAADWYDRQDTLTPGERVAFHAWLASDPAHASAYDTMRRMMLDVALLEAAEDLPLEQARQTRSALADWFVHVFAQKAGWGVLVGAAICALIIIPQRPPAPVAQPAQILATKTGERGTVTLADKSVVYLNAATQIAVTYSEHTRLLNLARGEAIFQVQKDHARPFRVLTAIATITAVGTRFGVDRVGDAVEVRVYEGTVQVAGKDNRALSRGQWLLLDPKRGVSGGSFAPEAYPNWRTGWLEADGMALSYVVARLNRYTNEKITIEDHSLVDAEINGRFRLDNTQSTLMQISAALNLDVDKRNHEILLRRRRE